MPAYVIADISIHDPETYERYKAVASDSLAMYGGRFAIRGGTVTTLEGTWNSHRFIMLEFPSADVARAWWASSEYAPAKALRLASAETNMILVEGPSFDPAAPPSRT